MVVVASAEEVFSSFEDCRSFLEYRVVSGGDLMVSAIFALGGNKTVQAVLLFACLVHRCLSLACNGSSAGVGSSQFWGTYVFWLNETREGSKQNSSEKTVVTEGTGNLRSLG